LSKYIFITGGVVSGLGKGITVASLGMLLKARGLNVILQKFDPYINVDPGTISPYQHGEVFVTDDGAETDLDLGHYERFTDENLSYKNNVTTGKIYWSVLMQERNGDYLGQTIQIVPHITNKIKENIYATQKYLDNEIVITEIGGTVGDIESLPFLEAIRQVSFDIGRENVLFIHVALVPYLKKSNELKTKPAQHSVKELLSLGIQPDVIIARCEKKMSPDTKDKLSLFCNVKEKYIIENRDCDSIYQVPLLFEEQNLANIVCEKLDLKIKNKSNLDSWIDYVNKEKKLTKKINIAIVGKYVKLKDAYISLIEALNHAGVSLDIKLNIVWIDAEKLEKEKNLSDVFNGIKALIIPGGFGSRGIDGMIKAVNYARENKILFLGICLGMHCAIIEYARNVLNLKDANSSEFDSDCENPVIDLMLDQKKLKSKGATMRLGKYNCNIIRNTLVHKIYDSEMISERHRHRFEFNNKYRSEFIKNNLIISGLNKEKNLVEIIELDKNKHPFFVAVQFHPELKSRPNKPHKLFYEFIKSAINNN
jgi:CTP synthase